jgi:hypothetical protein
LERRRKGGVGERGAPRRRLAESSASSAFHDCYQIDPDHAVTDQCDGRADL